MEFLRHEIERTPALGKTDDPSWNLETRIYQSISQDASDRLKLIRERVSREAMALAPGYEERKILADINRVLARHSIEQMTIADILQMDNLPPHAQRSPKDLYTVRAMLVLYLQRLNGEVFRAPNSGLKGSYPVKNIRAQFSNYINPGALDVLRKLGVYGPSAIKRWKKK
ncbi:hypothetical protein HY968_04770 [Candidatus Kaiserbacteria bacterium]|nr:hypothetical protein [Candidatus Kaiserbacteria bacterium]